MMKYAYTTREARQHLSELLEAARKGEEVLITSPNQSSVRLVADRPSKLSQFRTWMASAVEIDEDPLTEVRDRAPARKVKL
ncbi:MAG TPA: type II toxin-antitoxin system prevent-host-death family antitoxin [Polyangiaceae bacterium]|nr:type II toxin-antitoxin system prevent-host-death family antitoxin [Polyangiaceae bacterium]